MKKRGFVTLAVGDEKYFRLAVNLLNSYKLQALNPMPFAIIADRENEYTKLFDKVVILEKSTQSYMDKIEMLNHAPYEQNIFIDADCLVYQDINIYWNFKKEKGVSCFGKSLPIDSKDGWFEIDDIGEYREQIDFIPQMHGGIIFFDKDEMTNEIYRMALNIAKDYRKYKFKYFTEPADEPILAICMAVNGCHPIELLDEEEKMFLFYPTVKNVRCNILKKAVSYEDAMGQVFKNNVKLIHWQNYFTETAKYQHEILRMEAKEKKGNFKNIIIYLKLFWFEVKKIQKYIIRKFN